jgi:hypothetical protein
MACKIPHPPEEKYFAKLGKFYLQKTEKQRQKLKRKNKNISKI